jgi:hypothetical protein
VDTHPPCSLQTELLFFFLPASATATLIAAIQTAMALADFSCSSYITLVMWSPYQQLSLWPPLPYDLIYLFFRLHRIHYVFYAFYV